MTTGEFLASAVATLKNADITSARLDCLLLLEDALQTDRTLILAHPERIIDHKTEVELHKKIMQRTQHTPLAYIRGKANFYGRTFLVNDHVLVPRPETEAMIELAKGLALPKRSFIADVGTGSGCIGITAALEIPDAEVYLLDIDTSALAVAARNAKQLGALDSVHIQTSDLLANCPASCDVLLANLPYVPDHYTINQAAAHEPKLALFAGNDGLDLYRRLWEQIASLTQKPGFVLTESLLGQHNDVGVLAKKQGFELTKTQSLVQLFTKI